MVRIRRYFSRVFRQYSLYPFPFPLSGTQVVRMVGASFVMWLAGSIVDVISTAVTLENCVDVQETNVVAAHFQAGGELWFLIYSVGAWITLAAPLLFIMLTRGRILSAKPFGFLQNFVCWMVIMVGVLGLGRLNAGLSNFTLFLTCARATRGPCWSSCP
jgi:hypothetical protein